MAAPAVDDPPAALFLFDDRIVWSSRGFTGGRTRRPTCTLLIGALGTLTVTVSGRPPLRTRAVLVGPQVERDVVAEKAGFYSLSLDPAHPGSRYLRDQVLAGRPLLNLRSQLDAVAVAAVVETLAPGNDCRHSRATADGLLQHFFPGLDGAPAVDARVVRVAEWLRRELPARADMRQLGELCHLSAGRLTHLFSRELGVSIRSYLRWSKMSKAIELLGSDRTVAEVAATIGFSDAAHFCRVLRTYYSVQPSLVGDPARVRVQVCGSDRGGCSR